MPEEIHGHCFVYKNFFDASTYKVLTPEILRCAQNDKYSGSSVFKLLRKETAVLQSIDDIVLHVLIHLYLQYFALHISLDYLNVHVLKGFIYTLRAFLAMYLALAGLANVIANGTYDELIEKWFNQAM